MYLKMGFTTFNQDHFIFTNKRNNLYYPLVINNWLKWICQKADKTGEKFANHICF